MIATPEEQRDQALRVEEALRQVLERQEAWHCNRAWEAWAVDTMGRDDFSLVTEDPVAIEELVQAVMSVSGAATVPNAATEALVRKQQRYIEEVERVDGVGLGERVEMLEAERDAALAAIERVTAERDAAMARIAKAWELHEPFTWSFGHGPVQSCKWCADHGVSQKVASWPCPTVAALDGAPEPEWEYRAKVVHPDWAGNHYIVFKHAPTRYELENPVLFNDSFGGVNELEGGKLTGLEYRTPASDWLPVEGESK